MAVTLFMIDIKERLSVIWLSQIHQMREEQAMSVAFEQLGAGQVGRLVYQVIGKDGPVFNPRNICYLPPRESALGAGARLAPSGQVLSNIATGLAGINFMAAFAEMGFSAAILNEVREVSNKIDQAREQILCKLEDITGKLKAIDVKVSENNLREALKFLAKNCVSENSIDLQEIKKIEEDVEAFCLAAGDFGYAQGETFRLSYDVRARLAPLHSLLYGVRQTVSIQHNIKVEGNPFQVLVMHPIDDYRPSNMITGELPISGAEAEGICDNLRQGIAFAWKSCPPALDGGGTSEKRARLINASIGDAESSIRLMLSKMEANRLPASAEEASWLWNSDMGLLWRLRKELKALGDY
jgi:hypothetical protein